LTTPEPFPIPPELLLVNLCPRFNKTALPGRELAAYELDWIDGEDADAVLVVRMKVWTMMRSSRLCKHPDDDSEESCDLRHLVGLDPQCRDRVAGEMSNLRYGLLQGEAEPEGADERGGEAWTRNRQFANAVPISP
jgi:hypothetical protein